MIKLSKILTIYNICQKDKDNTDHYINSIRSILNQNFADHRVVISACKNSDTCIRRLRNEFGNKIDILLYGELTANITFNKTVRECIKKYGNFQGYLYIDSGITLTDPNIIGSISERMDTGIYSMITVQTDTDNISRLVLGFDWVIGNDYIIPIGKGCNCHCQLFTHDLYETYGGKIIPDVFKAYCTESVFSFLNAAIKKKWVIIKDIIIHHHHGLDGASTYFACISERFGTPWNNFLFGRNTFDFMNDPEAINAGLGYEEIAGIMMHKSDMYDENGFSRDPEKLKMVILKYLYSNKQEIDYDNLAFSFNPV